MKAVHVVSLACLLLGASALQATPILPGQTVVPVTLPNPGEEVDILDEDSGSFNIPFGSSSLFGDYEMGVFVDPWGITCAGCLNFFYNVRLSPNATGVVTLVGGGGFEGFETSIGWVLGGDEGDMATAKHPINATRDASGTNIVFGYNWEGDTSNIIFPGSNSGYLVIATNATAYDRSGVLGIAGGNMRDGPILGLIEGAFAPVRAVPEPGSLALLGTGVAGMFIARRRRKAKLAA